jgi:hypothetical protein
MLVRGAFNYPAPLRASLIPAVIAVTVALVLPQLETWWIWRRRHKIRLEDFSGLAALRQCARRPSVGRPHFNAANAHTARAGSTLSSIDSDVPDAPRCTLVASLSHRTPRSLRGWRLPPVRGYGFFRMLGGFNGSSGTCHVRLQWRHLWMATASWPMNSRSKPIIPSLSQHGHVEFGWG